MPITVTVTTRGSISNPGLTTPQLDGNFTALATAINALGVLPAASLTTSQIASLTSLSGITGGLIKATGLNTLATATYADIAALLVAGQPTTRPGFLLADGSVLSSWRSLYGAAISANTTNLYRAVNTLNITPSSQEDGAVYTFSNTTQINLGATINVVVYVPNSVVDNATATSLRLALSIDGTEGNAAIFTFASTYFSSPGWQILTVAAGETGLNEFNGAGFSYTGVVANAAIAFGSGNNTGVNFTSASLVFTGANTSGVQCQVDSIWIGAKAPSKITFTFDGVDSSHLLIAQMLAAYKWKAANVCDGASVAGASALLLALKNTYGWDIGSMGSPVTHTNYSTSPGLLAGDITTRNAQFTAVGLPAPTVFAFPFNASVSANNTALAAAGFTFSRTDGVDILQNVGYGYANYSDSVKKVGQTQLLGVDFATVKARIDAVVKIGGVLSLSTYSATPLSTNWSTGIDLTTFTQILDYIASIPSISVVQPSAL